MRGSQGFCSGGLLAKPGKAWTCQHLATAHVATSSWYRLKILRLVPIEALGPYAWPDLASKGRLRATATATATATGQSAVEVSYPERARLGALARPDEHKDNAEPQEQQTRHPHDFLNWTDTANATR